MADEGVEVALIDSLTITWKLLVRVDRHLRPLVLTTAVQPAIGARLVKQV